MNEDKKISNALSWLITINILLIGLCSLCFNWLDECLIFNEYTIYVQAIMPILTALVTIFAIVIFICKYKKLAEKKRYWICIILMTIMSVLWNMVGADYLKDIFSEPQTVSSDYYTFNNNLIIYNESDGSSLVLKINDEQYELLSQSESVVDKNKILMISEHIAVYGKDKTILVDYYPNTEIVKKIDFCN